MKCSVLLLCLVGQILVVNCKVVPDYLPQPCSKTDPDYNACSTKKLNELGPYLLKGVPELNIPQMDPMEIPLFVANRTVDDCANLSLTLRNATICGFNTTSLRSFRYNVETMRGELELHIDYLKSKAEYELSGHLSKYQAMSAGYWEANATDVGFFFNYSLKVVEREGVNYYTLDDFDRYYKVEDAYLNLTSKNPASQVEVNMLTKFVNEDVQRAVKLGNLLFKPSGLIFYRELVEKILSSIPVDELTPS